MNEVWKPVRGFNGYYATQNGLVRGPSGKIMSTQTTPAGYIYVMCSLGYSNRRKLLVHRAVLLAFVGCPQPGHETRHLNGNPADNRLDNLVWGTPTENSEDRRRHGRMIIPHESPFTKLKPQDIPRIFQLHDSGLSSRAIGKIFSTSHATILKILRGESWKGYARTKTKIEQNKN